MIPSNNYQYLGKKTFRYWLWQRSSGALTTFVAFLALLFLANTVFPQTVAGITIPWAIVLLAVSALSIFMFLGAFLSTRFIYNNTRFALDDDALRIRRGVISREEVAMPYRQIQSVNIERPYSYRMFGLSRLVILTAGNGFGQEGQGGEANEVFSAIDTDIALWLQGELLKRTNVQKVSEVYSQQLPQNKGYYGQ